MVACWKTVYEKYAEGPRRGASPNSYDRRRCYEKVSLKIYFPSTDMNLIRRCNDLNIHQEPPRDIVNKHETSRITLINLRHTPHKNLEPEGKKNNR